MKTTIERPCRSRTGRRPPLRIRLTPSPRSQIRRKSLPAPPLERRTRLSADAEREPAQSPPSESPRSDALQLYLREIGRVKLLTLKEETALARRIKRGDKAAREHMITANLRLVVKIARDYEGLGVPLLDLINEGNIGLMKGVERFDLGKGAKLSTYAALWIKQQIRRALSNQSKTIRLPVHVVDRVAHLRRAEMKLQETLGREPTDVELAHELQLDPRRVAQYRLAAKTPVSLDAPLGDDESHRIAEVVADPNAALPFDHLVQTTDNDLAREILATLPERERTILTLRFGLTDGTERTLEEIGQRLDLTRERIRQIQEQALKKLRTAMEARDRPAAEEPITLAVAA